MKSVLVCCWGRFEKWSEAKYYFIGQEQTSTARSTLRPLMDNLNPHKTIIILLDTIAVDGFSDYRELCDNVKDGAKDFIRSEVGERGNVEVVVAPGIGSFQVNGGIISFDGSPTDFYYFILHRLAEMLIELEDKSFVWLDLTHGLNFMPTMTYRAVYEVLGVLSFSKNISFTVYNAEPFVNKEVSERIAIHPIEMRKTVEARLSPHRLAEKGKCLLLKRRKGVSDWDLHGKINECALIENDKVDELNAFLSAMVNALPLAILTFYPDKDAMRKRLSNVLDVWVDAISCTKSSIYRKAEFTEDFMRYTRLWLAAECAGLSRHDEVSLNELYKTADKLFGHNGLQISLVNRALKSDVERKLGNESPSTGWKKLRDIICGGGQFSHQNFLAHAGLEYNVTEASWFDGEIMLRYASDRKKDIIEACLQGLLKSVNP